MTYEYQKRAADVLRRMRALAILSNHQRSHIDSLDAAAWPHEMAALAKLWPACPDLVEQYLDVMIAALHDFPECLETGPAPTRPTAIPLRRGRARRPTALTS